MQVKNHDIASLNRRINAFIFEMANSTSVSTSGLSAHDLGRFKAFFTEIKDFIGWMGGRPALDLPKTHPTIIELDAAITVPDNIKNNNILDLIHHLKVLQTEAVNSQSKDVANGVSEPDKARWDELLAKVDALIEEFITKHQNPDLPETATLEGPIVTN